MKKISLALAVLCVAALTVCGTEPLLSLIPEGSCGVLSVDFAALWRHPQVAESLRRPEIAGELNELENVLGCRISDVEELLVFVDKSPAESNYIGGLIRSRAAAKLFSAAANTDTVNAISRKAAKTGMAGNETFRSRVEKIGDREVVFFSDSQKSEASDIGLVALSPEVLLAARRDMLPKMLKAPRITPVALAAILKARIPGRYPVWAVWNDPRGRTEEPAKDAQAPKIEEKIIGVSFAFGFSGKEQLDQKFIASIRCNTRDFASTLGMMIPGYVQMGVAMAFQQKPEIGQELIGNFRCNTKGFDVFVSLFLPKTLSEKLESFVTDSKVLAAPDPVPRDIKAK